ncbi:MAG: biotin-dependent carboxyltransferase family protein [Acidobacteria bacterium]|nr:biotin-dependent carboxyltransferase family protein [Acidobacteriota bacterium]
MTASVMVLSPGVQTTVQDLGRWGFQSLGIPVAGPMDPFAHRLANALVGNPRAAATLEAAMVGPTLQFDESRVIAVTGAMFDLHLDDQLAPMNTPLAVRPGSVLRFGERRSGARAYLAMAGGVDTTPVLGSRSTHVPTRMGGFEGRALRRGDRLAIGPASVARMPPRGRGGDVPVAPSPAIVRVLAGPQANRFVPEALEAFASAPYHVSVHSDRMGVRLTGPTLRHIETADIVSDATPVGSVQVPASGEPIVLMADRQTTGGYAKLATVIAADIGVLGQACPGDRIQFTVCEHREAIAALLGRERQLLALEQEPA